MAASSGNVASPQESLYFDSDFTTAEPTWAQLTMSSTGIILDANLVPKVVAIDPIEETSNLIEITPAGSPVTESIPGAASLGEFSFTVALNNANTIHASLAGKESGDAAAVVVLTKTGTTAQTAYFLLGKISAVSMTPGTGGDYQRLTVSMALGQKPVRVNQS